MSVKSIARAAAASCVLAAALGAGAAGAQSYGYGSSDRYQSEQRSSRYHHSGYRTENAGSQRSMREGREMRGEGEARGMQSAAYSPPAFQIPLSRVADAKGALKGATVRDEDGNSIGSVRDVLTSPGGQAEAIKINVGGVWGVNGKTVIVDAHDFRFESDRHELTADLSKGQIESLPGVKP